jgi:hypothetical protein
MTALIAGKLSDDELVQLALLLHEDSRDEFWSHITHHISVRVPELATPRPDEHKCMVIEVKFCPKCNCLLLSPKCERCG